MGDPILILCGDDAVQRADLFHPERTPWQKSAIPQVSEHCGVPVLYSREHDATAGRHSAQGPRILGRQGAVGSRDWRAVGISRSGCPRSSARRSVNSSETACSSRSASSCTSSQEYPRCSSKNVSIKRCRRTSRNASARPQPVREAPGMARTAPVPSPVTSQTCWRQRQKRQRACPLLFGRRCPRARNLPHGLEVIPDRVRRLSDHYFSHLRTQYRLLEQYFQAQIL